MAWQPSSLTPRCRCVRCSWQAWCQANLHSKDTSFPGTGTYSASVGGTFKPGARCHLNWHRQPQLLYSSKLPQHNLLTSVVFPSSGGGMGICLAMVILCNKHIMKFYSLPFKISYPHLLFSLKKSPQAPTWPTTVHV